jgi:hypothetical protein
MFIVFRLIGVLIANKQYEIRSNFSGTIKLSGIHKLFISMGFEESELSELKFVIDSRIANDLNKEYHVSEHEEKVIVIISSNIPVIRNKLAELFLKNGIEIISYHQQHIDKMQRQQSQQQGEDQEQNHQRIQQQQYNNERIQQRMQERIKEMEDAQPISIDQDIIKPLTENKSEEPIKITPELVKTMNDKTIKLFSDDDFKSLLRIYMRRPELFNILSLYIQNSDLVEESFGDNIELSEEDIVNYNIIGKELLKLGLTISDDKLKQKIIKYKGHLNLILRSILTDSL